MWGDLFWQKVKIMYIKYRNFSPKKKIWIFLGGGKKPKKTKCFFFFKKKTIWFKPWFKPRLKTTWFKPCQPWYLHYKKIIYFAMHHVKSVIKKRVVIINSSSSKYRSSVEDIKIYAVLKTTIDIIFFS